MWKVGLCLFGLLSLIAAIGASFAYAHSQGKELGVTTCQSGHKDAAIAALENARKEYYDGLIQLHEKENAILAAPAVDDDNISPLLMRQLDGMR